MKEEIKDPALGTIVDDNIKIQANPNQPIIHVREKPHKGNPYKLAIIILSIVVFLLIAGIAYLLFCPLAKRDDTADQNTPTCPETPVCENTLKEEEAVKAVIAELRETILGVLQENNQSAYTLLQIYDSGASYQPEGYDIGVPLTKSYGISLDSQNLEPGQTLYNLIDNYTIFQALEKTLIKAGFTNTNQKVTTSSAGPGAVSFVNQTSGVVCSVNPNGADCGYKTWYNKADAQLSNTLAQVYKEATGKDAHYLVAQVSAIKDSPVAPYQNISVGMPGFGALFYRLSPDAEWQYFAEGQGAPQCSEYNTDDLRKAFAGFSCFPDTPGPMETVQP